MIHLHLTSDLTLSITDTIKHYLSLTLLSANWISANLIGSVCHCVLIYSLRGDDHQCSGLKTGFIILNFRVEKTQNCTLCLAIFRVCTKGKRLLALVFYAR